MDRVIDIRGVRLDVDGRRYLDGVDLHVDAGETVIVAGGPGSGKSMLPRLALGMPGLEPDRFAWEGEVRVHGQDLAGLGAADLQALRRRIGSVLRQGGLIDNMDIRANISLPLAYHFRDALGGDWIETRCDRVLSDMDRARLGAPGLRPVELNREERIYASLARALVCEPFLLLYDSPCAGLSPGSAARLRHFLFEYEPLFTQRLPGTRTGGGAATSVARLVSTADLDTYLDVGDRFYLLSEGHLEPLGDAEAVRRSQDPRVRELRQGCGHEAAVLAGVDAEGALGG